MFCQNIFIDHIMPIADQCMPMYITRWYVMPDSDFACRPMKLYWNCLPILLVWYTLPVPSAACEMSSLKASVPPPVTDRILCTRRCGTTCAQSVAWPRELACK